MAKELAISIGHHTLGDAMKPHNLLKIEVVMYIFKGNHFHPLNSTLSDGGPSTT